MDAFCRFSRAKGIRTVDNENYEKIQGRFERENLKSAFFNI